MLGLLEQSITQTCAGVSDQAELRACEGCRALKHIFRSCCLACGHISAKNPCTHKAAPTWPEYPYPQHLRLAMKGLLIVTCATCSHKPRSLQRIYWALTIGDNPS